MYEKAMELDPQVCSGICRVGVELPGSIGSISGIRTASSIAGESF